MTTTRKNCFCCDVLTFRYEMDHFPVPQRLGGTEVTPLCIECHDLKDRTPLMAWNALDAIASMSGVWEKANRTERILIMKLTVLAQKLLRHKNAAPKLYREERIRRWLARWERLAAESGPRYRFALNYGRKTWAQVVRRTKVRSYAAGYWRGVLKSRGDEA